MNPGAAEEGAKAVGSIVDSLKTQPLSLALVLMNIALLALVAWVAKSAGETRRQELTQIINDQKETRELLAKCIVIDPEKLIDALKGRQP